MTQPEALPPLGAAAAALAAEAGRRGLGEVEIYEKRGRSRRFERQGERESASQAVEEGWAMRAGDRTRSFFFAATGAPAAEPVWPEATPHPLRLPAPGDAAPWSEPADLALPLATENEARALLDALERAVAREQPAARWLGARLEDGSSEAALVSSRGVRAVVRARAAYLRIEAQLGKHRLLFESAERALARVRPEALARRLVDRCVALEEGEAPPARPSELLLGAPLAARLVQVMAPLFAGREAAARRAALAGATGGAASPELTLIDDGRYPEGLLAAAVDGEGMPCRRVALIEAGRLGEPLLAWWEGSPSSGCARRASWRDLPRRAPTHTLLEPGQATVAELVESVASGVYLLDAEGGVRLDPATLAFAVPVSGFRLTAGRAVAPLGPCRLTGTLGGLLAGVTAIGRDLVFVPGDGMFGSPTLRATGLGLEPGF